MNEISRHLEIVTDLDDTGVNLSKEVIRRYNEDYNDNFDWRENKSYLWQDTKAPADYFKSILSSKGIFLNAEPIDGFVDIMTKLHNDGFSIKICTLPQWYSWYCFQEKIEWVEKYLPFINIAKDLHMTGGKDFLSKPNRILYDDNLEHLISWKSKGGLAVAFPQGWNKEFSIRKNYKEFYKYVMKYENVFKERKINAKNYL